MAAEGFVQRVLNEGQVQLLGLLVDRKGFNAAGCLPHESLHLMDNRLLEKLLLKGLSANACMPPRTFLLHTALPHHLLIGAHVKCMHARTLVLEQC